jgi:hypothetical protein
VGVERRSPALGNMVLAIPMSEEMGARSKMRIADRSCDALFLRGNDVMSNIAK